MLSTMEPGLLKPIPAFPRFPNPAIGHGLAQIQRGNVLGVWGVHESSHVHVC